MGRHCILLLVILAACNGSDDTSVDGIPACPNPADACANNAQNGAETDIDCGGPSRMGCRRCDDGQTCSTDLDCASALCDQGTCAAYPGVLGYVACTSNGDCGSDGICSSASGGYCRWSCTSAIHCQQLFGPDHQCSIREMPGSGFIACEAEIGSLESYCRYEREACDSCWDDCNGVDDDGDLQIDEGWFDYQANKLVLCASGGTCVEGQCLLECN
jgi:hypothetical protein